MRVPGPGLTAVVGAAALVTLILPSAVVAAEPAAVSGTAVHRFSTAVTHSEEPTATGSIRRSTDIVEIDGDLRGKVLYHATSEVDTTSGTLEVTGKQLFSGTVLGSEPLIFYDEEFRFEGDLETGAVRGEVLLRRSEDAGPGAYETCHLVVEGSGEKTPEGDVITHYSGTCTPSGE